MATDPDSSTFGISGNALGTPLQSLLMADSITPGAEPDYQLCKTIYLYHPLGGKMAEAPVKLAMNEPREIKIPNSPEECVRDAFLAEWEKLQCDKHIFNTKIQSRIYGICSVVYGAEGVPTDRPVDPKELYKLNLYFNVFDPLNTAGSLVLNQNPNSPDFQKFTSITAGGQPYHRSRSCVVMNENPIFISFSTAAFGFVGRSVYQRALFALKSFITSMLTDDMVQRKAGVIVAKMKPAGSIADKLSSALQGIKRNIVKQAQTENVINITPDESIETLNLMNTDAAMTTSRNNIIENIASSASMPPKLLLADSYAGVLANGTEDYKQTMQYINGIRREMADLYAFFDNIVMYRAWNPDFYATVQQLYPEYQSIPYTKAFFDWRNSFSATWPSLLAEPESEKIQVDEIRLKAIIAMMGNLSPNLDPENKSRLIQWACDNFNSLENMFDNPLELDFEALAAYTPPEPQEPQDPTKPHFNL